MTTEQKAKEGKVSAEMREAFERIAILTWHWHQPRLCRMPDGSYANERTKYAWDGFQSGADYQRERDALICESLKADICLYEGDDIGTYNDAKRNCASAIRHGSQEDE